MTMAMDPLADLPGADEFEALLAREELRRGRTGESLAVAMLDLDGLRAREPHHGAAAGSEVLRLCVDDAPLHPPRGRRDRRTGPDEFGVLLHGDRRPQRGHLGGPLRGRAGRDLVRARGRPGHLSRSASPTPATT